MIGNLTSISEELIKQAERPSYPLAVNQIPYGLGAAVAGRPRRMSSEEFEVRLAQAKMEAELRTRMSSEERAEFIQQLKRTPGVIIPDDGTFNGGFVAGTMPATETQSSPQVEPPLLDETQLKYPQGQE